MKTVCYIIEMNSSVGSLLERLNDMGAKWAITQMDGDGYVEIYITAPEHLIPEIENEMAWYV